MKEMEEKKLLIPTPEIAAEIAAVYEAISNTNDEEKYMALCDKFNEYIGVYDLFNKSFEEGGKVGLKDMTGKILVPAMYAQINNHFDYTCCRNMPVTAKDLNGKYGIVAADGSGKQLCPFIYDYTAYIPWSNSYAARIGKKYAILNARGEVIVEPIADSYCECMNGIIVFESEGKYGLVTEYGTYAEPVYDEIDENDDAVYATLGDKKGYIDEGGKFIDENDEETLEEAVLLYWVCN